MVCSYLFSTPDQESSVQYLDNVYFRLAAMMEQRYERQEGCTPALSSVIEVSWTVFSNHRHGLTGCLDNIARTLDLSRQYHLEVILRPFENLAYADLQDRDRRYHLGVSLDLLAEYLDLLGTHPDLRQSKYL